MLLLNWLLILIVPDGVIFRPMRTPHVFCGERKIVLTENKDLTNIETASPGLLASTAETDRGEGDVGHIGHLGLGQVRPP